MSDSEDGDFLDKEAEQSSDEEDGSGSSSGDSEEEEEDDEGTIANVVHWLNILKTVLVLSSTCSYLFR